MGALKIASPEFTTRRQLAKRFGGIMRSSNLEKPDSWCEGADRGAVRTALTMPWSSRQTRGQTSRIETPRRAMYDRARADAVRAWLLPLCSGNQHRG